MTGVQTRALPIYRFEEAGRDYATILESRLLIIDDLGTESMKPATLPELLQILDQRHGAGLRTLFCTNAEPAALRDLYDERLWSRLIGRCTILRFFGDDLRLRAARTRRESARQLPQQLPQRLPQQLPQQLPQRLPQQLPQGPLEDQENGR